MSFKHHYQFKVAISLLVLLGACKSEINFSFTENPALGGSTSPICPTEYGDFIEVLGDNTLNTNDFCLMKFDARDVSGRAVSQSAGMPWVYINGVDAKAACLDLNTGSSSNGSYDLITNAEWMTIARDIESVGANWSGGTPGVGEMARGHTDNSPSNAIGISDPNDPYTETGNDELQAPGSGWEQKRTFALSNDEIVWDLAGNVWNLVDWEESPTLTLGPRGCTDSFVEFQSVTIGCGGDSGSDTLELDDFSPTDTSYNSTQSVGQFRGGNGGVVDRGGRWTDSVAGGLYSVAFSLTTTDERSYVGFRCVWRPH